MSRTRPHDLDEIALQLPCPFCGAQADEWCTAKSGEWATWLHGRRGNPIRDAWCLGYEEYEHYLHLAYMRGDVTAADDTYWGRHLARHRCSLCPTVVTA